MPLLTRSDHASYRRSIGGGLEWLVLASGGIFAWNLLRIASETMVVLLRGFANFGQLFLLVVIAGAMVVPLLQRSCSYVRQNVGRHDYPPAFWRTQLRPAWRRSCSYVRQNVGRHD